MKIVLKLIAAGFFCCLGLSDPVQASIKSFGDFVNCRDVTAEKRSALDLAILNQQELVVDRLIDRRWYLEKNSSGIESSSKFYSEEMLILGPSAVRNGYRNFSNPYPASPLFLAADIACKEPKVLPVFTKLWLRIWQENSFSNTYFPDYYYAPYSVRAGVFKQLLENAVLTSEVILAFWNYKNIDGALQKDNKFCANENNEWDDSLDDKRTIMEWYDSSDYAETVLHCIAKNNNIPADVWDTVLQILEVDFKDKYKHSPSELKSKYNVYINKPNKNQKTALSLAREKGNAVAIEKLLNTGCISINDLILCKDYTKNSDNRLLHIDDAGNTKLHRAVTSNNLEEIKDTIKKFDKFYHANDYLNHRNNNQQTALDLAIVQQDERLAGILLASEKIDFARGPIKNSLHEKSPLFLATQGVFNKKLCTVLWDKFYKKYKENDKSFYGENYLKPQWIAEKLIENILGKNDVELFKQWLAILLDINLSDDLKILEVLNYRKSEPLYKKNNWYSFTPDYKTIFHWAVDSNFKDEDWIFLLNMYEKRVENNLKDYINTRSKGDQTPLYYSFEKDDVIAQKYLLQSPYVNLLEGTESGWRKYNIFEKFNEKLSGYKALWSKLFEYAKNKDLKNEALALINNPALALLFYVNTDESECSESAPQYTTITTAAHAAIIYNDSEVLTALLKKLAQSTLFFDEYRTFGMQRLKGLLNTDQGRESAVEELLEKSRQEWLDEITSEIK